MIVWRVMCRLPGTALTVVLVVVAVIAAALVAATPAPEQPNVPAILVRPAPAPRVVPAGGAHYPLDPVPPVRVDSR